MSSGFATAQLAVLSTVGGQVTTVDAGLQFHGLFVLCMLHKTGDKVQYQSTSALGKKERSWEEGQTKGQKKEHKQCVQNIYKISQFILAWKRSD